MSIDYFHSTLEDLVESGLHGSGIFSALASYSNLLKPLNNKYNQWNIEMKNDISNPIPSSSIRYSEDGIWFNEVFRFSKLKKLITKIESSFGNPDYILSASGIDVMKKT